MSVTRMDDLTVAWLNDKISAAERAELEDILLHDPDARRRFLDHCVGEMALVESLTTTAHLRKNYEKMGVKPEKTRSSRRLKIRPRSRPSRAIAINLVAAGIAALLLIAVLLIPSGHSLHVTGGSLVVNGQVVPTGARITLPLTDIVASSTGAELKDPVGIILNAGPESHFAIRAPGEISLESGQLTLHVDKQRAPATSVQTGELVVQVVGTHFHVARNLTRSDVDVDRGTVRVSTTATTQQETRLLTAGMHVAANDHGFIDAKPKQTPSESNLRLVVLFSDGSQRSHDQFDQPLRLPSGRPFTLRAEVDEQVKAVRFMKDNRIIKGPRPNGIEEDTPYYLWGNGVKGPHFLPFNSGTHRLSVTCFADQQGEHVISTKTITVIVE
jgi:ferric-dicitrate binding protein FerR (iron transport regulator)